MSNQNAHAPVMVLKTMVTAVTLVTITSLTGCFNNSEDYYKSTNSETPAPAPTPTPTPTPTPAPTPAPTPTPTPSKSTLAKPASLVKELTGEKLTEYLKINFPAAESAIPNAKCDVVVKKYTFNTHGVQDEVTKSTAAIMMPKGDAEECQNNRPIFLYAHGTTVNKAYDYSQVETNNPASYSSTSVAANFAAQGYIVVAPNYAGYDESDLDYHPYLNAKQQSHEMEDALIAAKEILETESNSSASDKLFIAGYSQGGHVALATARHFDMIGQKVTATVPMSGPYAMLAFGDAIFAGKVNIGATIFAPMIAVNYQKDYGGIYDSSNDIVNEKYADGIETLIPGDSGTYSLLFSGKLPKSALFEKIPTNRPALANMSPASASYAYGFDETDYLIQTEFREKYILDAIENPDGSTENNVMPLPPSDPKNPLRIALKQNDLRLYLPKSPVMLCGGNQDPTVFFDENSGAMTKVWQQQETEGKNLNVITLDIDITNQENRELATVNYIGDAKDLQAALEPEINKIQTNFKSAYSNKLEEDGALATTLSYHGGLASFSCFNAASVYFNQFND